MRPSKIPQSGPAAAWAANGVEDIRIVTARMEAAVEEPAFRSLLILLLEEEERLSGSNEEDASRSSSSPAMNPFFSNDGWNVARRPIALLVERDVMVVVVGRVNPVVSLERRRVARATLPLLRRWNIMIVVRDSKKGFGFRKNGL